jgi:sensor histidine kinase regulating citrate/malate metabolism
MTLFGREIATRIIGMVVGVIVLIVAVGLFVKSCDNRRDRAAQERLDSAQAGAAAESSADAINTVSRSGEAQAESEALSRANEKEIRNAEGANERVGAGVNTAGLRALCRREAYRNSDRCKIFRRDRP